MNLIPLKSVYIYLAFKYVFLVFESWCEIRIRSSSKTSIYFNL